MIILQLLAVVAFPIVIAVILTLLNNRTRLGKIKPIIKDIFVGLVFGGIAILATHFGVDIGNGVKVNVRDAGPLIAGLLFSPLSGVIAGLIGGIERFFVGGYTVLACTIGTIFAGVFGALLRKFLFKEKPNFFNATLVGLVTEVFHMLLVFFTHMNNITEAYNKVIDKAALPMIAGVSIGMMIATIAVEFIDKDYKKLNLHKETLSNQVLKVFYAVVFGAFIITQIFNFYVQDEVATNSAIDEIDIEINDIKNSVNSNILHIAENMKNDLEEQYTTITNDDLVRLCEEYGVSEAHIINDSGIIIYSSNSSDVGFDMNNSEQSSKFLSILSDENHESVVANFENKANDDSTEIKYAAIYYDGGILQVGYNRYLFEESISDVTSYRHLGDNGFIIISADYRNSYMIISNELSHTEESLSELGDDLFFLNSTDVSELNYKGETYIVRNTSIDGYYIIAFYLKDEVVETRNVSLYLTSFLQIIVYTLIFGEIYFVTKHRVTDNIEKINTSLGKLSSGDLDSKLDIKGCLEFESLSTSINTAVDYLKHANEEQQARLKKELDFARSIQLSALPNGENAYSEVESFKLHALMHPAVEVGGDFYDFYFVGKDHFVITIADVSGKSFPAAMFMMQSKAIIKSLVQKGLSISEALTQANNELCASNEAGMFLTLFMASINIRTGECDLVNAGHNPQLLSHEGKFEYLKLNPGFILGGIDGFNYQHSTIQLKPGDTFVLYTDGITEALNGAHELYGEDRLINYLNSNKFESNHELCDGIVNNVNEFANGAPQADDMTLLSLTYKGSIRKKAITVDAKIENINQVTEYTNNILADYKIEKKIIGQIDIAIDELFGNICKYAYPDKEGKASLVIEVDEKLKQLSITFIDQGIKYNPLDLEDPNVDLPLELREIGGLGIFIVKQSMDNVEYVYKNNNNILKITKSLE